MTTPSRPASNARRGWLALGLFGVVALAAPPASAQVQLQRKPSEDVAGIHDRCVDLARSDPKAALDRAYLWKSEGGGFAAEHCIAMAYFMLKDYAGAAQRFEALANAMMGMPPLQRAQALDQAGQSWLDANEPDRAKAAFDAALALGGQETDLLIDRSEAYAALHKYWDAIDDLNSALERDPKRADALIYRATAYRYVDSFDLAMEDIERAITLVPNSPAAILERGNIRRLKGDIAGARADWVHVKQLSPKTAEGKAADLNLEHLAGSAAVEGKKKPGS
jgi:tetratricopeptide (TPR) repeat protein